MLIGITGGYGSGKSSLAKHFGFFVIDADKIRRAMASPFFERIYAITARIPVGCVHF